MNTIKFTPYKITELAKNEVFVFGSNIGGYHGGGAARIAVDKFGAEWGNGVGMQGQSYAIPTMGGSIEGIKPYIDGFIDFAAGRPEIIFLVTRIGCGIAGYTDSSIAPLFARCVDLDNVCLPKSFYDVIMM